MTNLCKVRSLLMIKGLRRSVGKESVALDSSLGEAERLLELEFGLSLDHLMTTPKRLYGKPYLKLNKAEAAEYTQIKRLIKRFLSEE